jgi:hypothetical protein
MGNAGVNEYYKTKWVELKEMYQLIAKHRGISIEQVVEKTFGVDTPHTRWVKEYVLPV